MVTPKSPVRKKQTVEQLVQNVLKHPDSAEFKNLLRKAARKDPANVLSTIIKYQHTMYSKEVNTWKMARLEAKDTVNPRRVMLTDLYEDIELDAFIYGIVHNKRVLKISNKPFKIVDASGKELPDKTALFQHQWFNDFVKLAMQSRFFGHSLIYFYEWDSEGRIVKTDLVPRRHVIPERNCWVKMQYDHKGMDFTEPPFSSYMIGVGKPDDLGLYEKAALLYILKKHSWQSWDEFEERFGIPIPVVETASTDTKVLNTVEKWLRDLSTGSYGIIPDGGKLTMVETGKTDAHQVFFKKIEMAQMELEVLFTGQIRETNKNGTYGKEKSKEEEAQEIVHDDKMFIASVINDQLIPQILIPNGYPLAKGERFDWNDGAKLSTPERLAIFKGAKDLGFKLDIKQVSEELDVKLEEAEEVIEAEPAPGNPKPPTKKPANKLEQSIKNLHTNIHKAYFGDHV